MRRGWRQHLGFWVFWAENDLSHNRFRILHSASSHVEFSQVNKCGLGMCAMVWQGHRYANLTRGLFNKGLAILLSHNVIPPGSLCEWAQRIHSECFPGTFLKSAFVGLSVMWTRKTLRWSEQQATGWDKPRPLKVSLSLSQSLPACGSDWQPEETLLFLCSWGSPLYALCVSWLTSLAALLKRITIAYWNGRGDSSAR